MKINVHIERVVLDGVGVERPSVLRGALQNELASQFAKGSLSHEFRGGAAVPYVAAGAIDLGENRTPAQVGRQIAKAVYRGIGARR